MFYFLTNIWETITYHFCAESPVCQEIVFGTHTKNKIKREKKKAPSFFLFWPTVNFSQSKTKKLLGGTQSDYKVLSLKIIVHICKHTALRLAAKKTTLHDQRSTI